MERSHAKGRQAEIQTTRDDPAIERWMGVDLLEHLAPDMNPYHYTHNNPINRFDPDGNTDFLMKMIAAIEAKLVVMRARENSAMNTQVNFRAGTLSFEGSGRNFALSALRSQNEAFMKNLPSEEQVVSTLDNIGTAADDANLIVGPTAAIFSAVPVAGEVVGGVSVGLSAVSVFADATKAVITGNGEDYLEASINLFTTGVFNFGSNAVTSLVKGTEKKMVKIVIDGTSNTLSTATSNLLEVATDKSEIK